MLQLISKEVDAGTIITLGAFAIKNLEVGIVVHEDEILGARNTRLDATKLLSSLHALLKAVIVHKQPSEENTIARHQ